MLDSRPWEYFWTVKQELPLGAAVSWGQPCFLKLWNQSFNFNEADVYFVLIMNPLFNRKKGQKQMPFPDLYWTSKLKMFVFSFSVYVLHAVFCDFVKSSYKFGIGWTATWYLYNTSAPFVALLQWKYTSDVLAALCSVVTANSIEKKNDERRLSKAIGKIISHFYTACESAFFNQHLAKKGN